jgi:DNA (cytosine-5)-methyltransferase 1
MQEVAADDWLLSRLPRVEILEAGLPCSGASRAGIAKRHLAKMEDHPHVGHLVASAILLIARLQPAVVLLENVPAYADTASAAILRAWFKDAGYKLAEATLSAQAFGSPEKRTRWFLVAFPARFELDLSDLLPEVVPVPVLADFLEAVPDDDERYRKVAYLAIKAERDAEAGKGFKQQFMHPTDTAIPTLRKGYAKGGSTDPRLVRPSDSARSRLLTSREHARIKGIDESMLNGAGEALGHQVCGQSVDARPVMAIGRRIAERMRAWCSGRAAGGAAGGIGANGVAAVGDVPTWASVVG